MSMIEKQYSPKMKQLRFYIRQQCSVILIELTNWTYKQKNNIKSNNKINKNTIKTIKN